MGRVTAKEEKATIDMTKKILIFLPKNAIKRNARVNNISSTKRLKPSPRHIIFFFGLKY